MQPFDQRSEVETVKDIFVSFLLAMVDFVATRNEFPNEVNIYTISCSQLFASTPPQIALVAENQRPESVWIVNGKALYVVLFFGMMKNNDDIQIVQNFLFRYKPERRVRLS